MTKAETLAALKNQLDSFYSLEQVIKIIEGIEPEPASGVLTEEQCDSILGSIENCFDRCGTDFIDLSSAEFEFGYDGKTVELRTVDFDVHEIMHSIGRVFEQLKS
jgi:hypothetical protein